MVMPPTVSAIASRSRRRSISSSLSMATTPSTFDQLSARGGDQRKCASLLETQPIGDRSEHVSFGDRVFRVAAIRQCHDTHSLRKTLNVATRFRNFTGKVSPQDCWKFDRKARFRCSASYFDVNGIDAGGVHLYEHFVIAVFRRGNFVVPQLF